MTVTSYLYSIFQAYGVFDLLAPFIVSYSLLHGTLRKSRIFGDNEKAYGVIAFAISLYFIYNFAMLQFAQRFFAAFFYFVTLIFFFLMLLSLIFGSFGQGGRQVSSWVVGIAIPIIFVSYLYALQSNPSQAASATNTLWKIIQDYLINTGLIIVIGTFAVFYIMFKWFTSPPKSVKPKEKVKKLFEEIDKIREEIMRQNQG